MSQLRLSEAIRIGSRIRPQGFGSAYEQLLNETSCAGIAATEGLSGQPIYDSQGAYEYLQQFYPVGKKIDSFCPICEGGYVTLWGCIFHLNDTHHLSRERIAQVVQDFGY